MSTGDGQERLLAEVMRSFGGASDARLAQVLQVLVRHLHGFAAEAFEPSPAASEPPSRVLAPMTPVLEMEEIEQPRLGHLVLLVHEMTALPAIEAGHLGVHQVVGGYPVRSLRCWRCDATALDHPSDDLG